MGRRYITFNCRARYRIEVNEARKLAEEWLKVMETLKPKEWVKVKYSAPSLEALTFNEWRNTCFRSGGAIVYSKAVDVGYKKFTRARLKILASLGI